MELCGIVCYCVELYGIAWYCIPTGAQFPFPGAQASNGQPGHGRERDFRCHCRSVHCIVHRTACTYIVLSAVWVQTPNLNCSWSSIIVGCGFYRVLCDPRTYRYTVHLRVRLLMDQLYPGSWFPLHRPHPLLCLPGSSRVVGASDSIWMHYVPFFRRGVCGQNLGFFRGRPSLSSPTCPLALFYRHIRLITLRLTQWARRKGVTDVTQAQNQTVLRQWSGEEWRGQREDMDKGPNIWQTHFFCANLTNTEAESVWSPLRMRGSKSSGDRTKTGIETPHWQLRVCQRVEACLSKPFLMIEWWTLEGAHLLLAQMTIFGHRRAAAYCDFTIITPRLEWIAWGCWDDKELVQG